METRKSAEPMWELEREIVLSRVFDAPRELVFEAWTNPDHLSRWFGPKGSAPRHTKRTSAWAGAGAST